MNKTYSPEGSHDETLSPQRRKLLQLCTIGGAATLCAVGAATVIGAPVLWVPRGTIKERWVKTIPVERLQDGQPQRVVIIDDVREAWVNAKAQELGSVWLIRQGQQIDAFNAVCPHLGCLIMAKESGGFVCPCHDSSFSREGQKLNGPSPRDLDRLATRIENGVVVVDFRSYRQGIAQREEVG